MIDWTKPIELVDGRRVVRVSRTISAGNNGVFRVWLADGTRGTARLPDLRNVAEGVPRWELRAMAVSVLLCVVILAAWAMLR